MPSPDFCETYIIKNTFIYNRKGNSATLCLEFWDCLVKNIELFIENMMNLVKVSDSVYDVKK